MPLSPWIGSTNTAAVLSPTAARSASASFRGTETNPGSIGPRLAFWASAGVAARAP